MKLELGDIVFRQAENGWVIIHVGEDDLGGTVYSRQVAEGDDVCDSLASAVNGAFDAHRATKYNKGMFALVGSRELFYHLSEKYGPDVQSIARHNPHNKE